MKYFTAILILIAAYIAAPYIIQGEDTGAEKDNQSHLNEGTENVQKEKPGIDPRHQTNQSKQEKAYLITNIEVRGA